VSKQLNRNMIIRVCSASVLVTSLVTKHVTISIGLHVRYSREVRAETYAGFHPILTKFENDFSY
jgi:hypothetical protein